MGFVQNVEAFNGLNGRQITALIPHVKYCIGIDSFLQHAAASVGVPMTVFWGGTKPEHFSYELHHNIHPAKKPQFLPNRIPHNVMNFEKLNIKTNSHSEKHIDDILAIIKSLPKKA